MPKMRVARRADDLGATHEQSCVVRFLAHVLLRHRLRRTTASRCRSRTSSPESKSGVPQQTQRYMPLRWLSQYSPENARSVPFLRVTRNCSGVSCAFQSASDFVNLVDHGCPRASRADRTASRRYAIVSPFQSFALTRPARRRYAPGLDNAHPDSFRRDVRVIGLVGFAHALLALLPARAAAAVPAAARRVRRVVDGARRAGRRVLRRERRHAVRRRASRSTASARGRCCSAGSRCSPAARSSRRSRPASYWLFPVVALMGVGNGVFHPCDFAILNANVAPRRLGHAYSHARRRRQPGLRAGAGRELRARRRRSTGAWRSRSWASSDSSRSACWRRSAALLTSHRAARRAHAHARGQHGPVPAAGDPAVLLLFRRPDDRRRSACRRSCRSALNAGSSCRWRSRPRRVTAYLLGGTAGIVAGGFLAARTDAPRPRRRRRARSPARSLLGVVGVGARSVGAGACRCSR